MYCMHCGIKLPSGAKFCPSCGKPQPEIGSNETNLEPDRQGLFCEITYQATGERWGIFPRDIGEFQALLVKTDSIENNNIADTIVKTSAKIEILSTSFSPDIKNKRHKKALENLVQELLTAGWVQQPERGKEWYSLRFHKSTR